jgi:tripartite-type tricarboxylate transporter receptor subunit TctC
MLRHGVAGCCLGAALLLSTGPAAAQTSYPNRPVTLVVPLSAGGTADILARIVAEKLRDVLGQPVVVENRPGGAGGMVGTESVVKAGPDGYTLLWAPQLTFSVAHILYPKLSFDPRALEPISVIATYPAILLGRPDLPANNAAELLAYARANPGKINYGSQGNGQIGHLTSELLMHMAKVKLVHVPFRGSAPALTALLAGQIDILPDLMPASKPHIEGGKIKLLAVASRDRLKTFPNVHTVGEVLPGFQSDTWMALAAPPGTPKEVIDKLSDAVARIFRMPELRARIAGLDVEPLGSTPAQMRELVRQSAERWLPVIEAAKIAIE